MHVISYHFIPYHTISYHIISYHIISYHTTHRYIIIYIYVICHKNIYHISIEVSFYPTKNPPWNATEAILHQPCWWGGPGAIVTGVATDALLHILIRWNGWNPKKIEVGCRRFHSIYIYYIYIYINICICIYRREFHFHASKGEQPRVPAFVFWMSLPVSFFNEWDVYLKHSNEDKAAKAWHVFLAKFSSCQLSLSSEKNRKNIRGNQKTEEVSLRHPPLYSHGQKLLYKAAALPLPLL